VVTSGQFTSSATKSAAAMDNVCLINGELFCDLLDEAGIVIPLDNFEPEFVPD